MAENTPTAKIPSPRRRFDMRELSRVATWGLAALGALTLAAYAASSPVGEDRLILAVASIRGVPPPAHLARDEDNPTRQLAVTIRELSAEREQLVARLDTLERTMGDVTSSIAKAAAAPANTPANIPANTAAAAPASPASAPALPPPVIASPEAIAAITAPMMPDLSVRPAPAAPAGDQPALPKTDAKTEFGIDLGRASSVEGLRQLWAAARAKHGAALEGLRPIVAVREVPRTTNVELRLVAGPLPNAATAARACAMLQGATCHPTVFEGQRLALR